MSEIPSRRCPARQPVLRAVAVVACLLPRVAGASEPVLDRSDLIATILAHNPNTKAAKRAFDAATARIPQRTALADPTVSYAFGPLSIASGDVRYGQVIRVGQRFPFPGKLALLGQAAEAEAKAVSEDLSRVRVELAFAASRLLDQLYMVERSADIYSEHVTLLSELEESANAQYAAGRGSQQAVLTASSERAHAEHRLIVLAADRAVVAARINGLLHRPPDTELPPAPRKLELPRAEPVTIDDAIATRPEARALLARMRSAEEAVRLAQREYYPDLSVDAAYNSMWNRPEHRFMVGLSINVPIQLGRRDAAVREAEAQVAMYASRLAAVKDEVAVEVAVARKRLTEAQHVVELYETRLVPIAKDRINAARSELETGRASFLSVIDAERNLRTVQLEQHAAVATLSTRIAELLRAAGRIPTDEGDER